MSLINKIIGWFTYSFLHYCWEHKRKFEVYKTQGYDEIEYVACRECEPDLFDTEYFKNLKRFDIPKEIIVEKKEKVLAK